MRRLLVGLAAVPAVVAAGWAGLVKAQGDSRLTVEPESLTSVHGDANGRAIHGEVTIYNRGRAGGVVHKVDGRIVSGGTGRVLVTRKDSRTPERGWWRSVCLVRDESCVGEVDIELDASASGPIMIELDIHEVGRRLKVHRLVELRATPAA